MLDQHNQLRLHENGFIESNCCINGLLSYWIYWYWIYWLCLCYLCYWCLCFCIIPIINSRLRLQEQFNTKPSNPIEL